MSTANFPARTPQSVSRRLESLCERSCVAVSSGFELPVAIPRISAESSSNGFLVSVNGPDSNHLVLECNPNFASWTGLANEMSIWVVNEHSQAYKCSSPERDAPRTEALSNGDRVVAISSSLAQGLDSVQTILEMALCEDPSLSTAASWIFDAADDSNLSGPHTVVLWKAT